MISGAQERLLISAAFGCETLVEMVKINTHEETPSADQTAEPL
jgi:hypothetical protein